MLRSDFAAQALERTRPHPLDARVRLTSDPDNLIALHNPGVKAVIWESAYPEDVKTELATFNTKTPNEIWSLPRVTFSSDGEEELFAASEDAPSAVMKDIRSLASIFHRAQIDLPYEFGAGAILVNKSLSCAVDNIFHGSEARGRIGRQRYFVPVIAYPHSDGFATRFIKTYSLDEEMGTIWFPGNLNRATYQAVARKIKEANRLKPEKLMSMLAPLNPQIVPPGHLAYFKGDRHDGPKEDWLVHSTPVPKAGVTRFLLLSP